MVEYVRRSWKGDVGQPDPEKAQLMTLIDGVNSHSVFRMSQMENPPCRAIANQLGRALDPAALKYQR